MWTMAQIQPGSTTVAVRVDAANPAAIAIDWDTPAPTVRLPHAAGQGSAAEVLADGDPCRVIVQQSQPLGMTNPAGLPLSAFALTVVPEHGAAYQTQVGNPVPVDALDFVYPGSQLPAKVMPGQPNSIAIDWARAASSMAGAR